MPTATQTSEARRIAERLPANYGTVLIGAIPGVSSISHTDYRVTYFADRSILIWSRHGGNLVLDEEQNYYRDTVEHLARCLGLFTQERRAEMLGHEDKWVDGIHWSATGEFLGV